MKEYLNGQQISDYLDAELNGKSIVSLVADGVSKRFATEFDYMVIPCLLNRLDAVTLNQTNEYGKDLVGVYPFIQKDSESVIRASNELYLIQGTHEPERIDPERFKSDGECYLVVAVIMKEGYRKLS